MPIADDSHDYLMVRIRTRANEAPYCLKNVDVYLRRSDPVEIVGIERKVGILELDVPEQED